MSQPQQEVKPGFQEKQADVQIEIDLAMRFRQSGQKKMQMGRHSAEMER